MKIKKMKNSKTPKPQNPKTPNGKMICKKYLILIKAATSTTALSPSQSTSPPPISTTPSLLSHHLALRFPSQLVRIDFRTWHYSMHSVQWFPFVLLSELLFYQLPLDTSMLLSTYPVVFHQYPGFCWPVQSLISSDHWRFTAILLPTYPSE